MICTFEQVFCVRFMYTPLLWHLFDQCRIMKLDILLMVSINGFGILLALHCSIFLFLHYYFFLPTFRKPLIILPFLLFWSYCTKYFWIYLLYILVTVGLQFLYGDTVVLCCSSEWSATPAKFVTMILLPYHILLYLTFWFIYLLLYSNDWNGL